MLLQVENLSKNFPVKKGVFGQSTNIIKAVDRVSFEIAEHEHTSIVGESGCGKTTLARMIIRLYPSSSGSIKFDGKDITTLKGKNLQFVRRDVQMVFQDPFNSLDPRFTIRNVLKEPVVLGGKQFSSKGLVEKRMCELIRAVGLEENMLNRYPHEFSGGERQRIAIARALMINPKLLILDEAVSSLDVIIQKQIINLLKDLQKQFKLTYLFISHNLRIIKTITHHIIVMYRGRIVEKGTSQQIFEQPLHPYTRMLLQAAVNYKADYKFDNINLPQNGQFVEHEDGHFVLRD